MEHKLCQQDDIWYRMGGQAVNTCYYQDLHCRQGDDGYK